jgi:hypothetical protein
VSFEIWQQVVQSLALAGVLGAACRRLYTLHLTGAPRSIFPDLQASESPL